MRNIGRYYTGKIMTVILLMSLISCTDYLEISPKDRISDTFVWETTQQADLFLNDIYASLPSILDRFDPWENWSDDAMDGAEGTQSRIVYSIAAYTPSNAESRWGTYSNIRKCNLFIEKVSASDLSDEWKAIRIAEARFLRAYFYSYLWTWYGGVPIITDVLNHVDQGDEIFRARNSVEETFKFITDECAIIANILPVLPNEKGRITKGAALTLKGFCELFYASPLYNTSNDKSKWALAAATNKEVMDLNTYALFADYGNLFYEENNFNSETILAKTHVGGTSIGRSSEGFAGPTYTGGAQTSYGMINPTQELINEYVMANGLLITDPESGYDPQNPYLNREKRFYQSIVFDGSMWNGAMFYSRLGVGSFNATDIGSSSGATNTGYGLRKGLKEKYSVPDANKLSSANSILFRYAEVLLNYAEAQNEAVGPDITVYNSVNQVRNRSDLPPLKEGLDQDEMRTAIWRERRVELAFEEKRWYDLVRLKIAGDKLNGTLHGIKIEEINGDLVYTIIPASGGTRVFYTDRNYLLPIPQSAIDRNKKLVQNPNY